MREEQRGICVVFFLSLKERVLFHFFFFHRFLHPQRLFFFALEERTKMACPDPSSLSNSALLLQKHLVRREEERDTNEREAARAESFFSRCIRSIDSCSPLALAPPSLSCSNQKKKTHFFSPTKKNSLSPPLVLRFRRRFRGPRRPRLRDDHPQCDRSGGGRLGLGGVVGHQRARNLLG